MADASPPPLDPGPRRGSAVTPLRVHVLAGASAGRRLRLDEPVLSIGREADNHLVIDEPHVSRHHAELRFDPQLARWTLVNLSPNGTKLGRKTVSKKPEPLSGEAEVRVGDAVLLRVTPTAGPTGGPQPDDPDPAPAQPGRSKRAKLWVGIGIYLAAMLAVVIVLAQFKGDDEPQGPAAAERFTDERLRQLVEQEPDPYPNLAPSAYQSNLNEATIAFAKRSTNPTRLFQAYRAYRAARQNNGGRLDDPADESDYLIVLDEVAQRVQNRYNRGYRLLTTGQYARSVEEFDHLLRLLNDQSDHPLAVNVRKLRGRAAAQLRD
ncbi:MAG: FHA domain-containing protein [Planctomycetota bacterium]